MSWGLNQNREERSNRSVSPTGRSRVAAVLAPIVLAFLSARGVITHSAAGVVSFLVFAAVVATVALSSRPTLRPVPILLVGLYGALLGFVGIGGARNPLAGGFCLFWVVLGVLGFVLVIGPDDARPEAK